MSAAEKLKELERRGAEGLWSIYEETHHEPTDDPKRTDRWIMDDGVILNWGDGDIPLGPAELIVALRNALPHIVAVVEAAENPCLFDYDHAGEQGHDLLVAALAALDEVLTADGRGGEIDRTGG